MDRWKERPAASEFMVRGLSVSQMLDLLEVWDSLSSRDKALLGFNDDAESRVRDLIAERRRAAFYEVSPALKDTE